jgi:hypothetical protein
MGPESLSPVLVAPTSSPTSWSFDRYKARWVLRGFTQHPGVNYDETFSLFVKPATIRTVLAITVSCDWLVQQLDVKNGFLHGTLSKIVFCI